MGRPLPVCRGVAPVVTSADTEDLAIAKLMEDVWKQDCAALRRSKGALSRKRVSRVGSVAPGTESAVRIST